MILHNSDFYAVYTSDPNDTHKLLAICVSLEECMDTFNRMADRYPDQNIWTVDSKGRLRIFLRGKNESELSMLNLISTAQSF